MLHNFSNKWIELICKNWENNDNDDINIVETFDYFLLFSIQLGDLYIRLHHYISISQMMTDDDPYGMNSICDHECVTIIYCMYFAPRSWD